MMPALVVHAQNAPACPAGKLTDEETPSVIVVGQDGLGPVTGWSVWVSQIAPRTMRSVAVALTVSVLDVQEVGYSLAVDVVGRVKSGQRHQIAAKARPDVRLTTCSSVMNVCRDKGDTLARDCLIRPPKKSDFERVEQVRMRVALNGVNRVATTTRGSTLLV